MKELEIIKISDLEYVVLAKLQYNNNNYILCAETIDNNNDVKDELKIYKKNKNEIIEIEDEKEYNIVKKICEKQLGI